jgi:hypothetical protein
LFLIFLIFPLFCVKVFSQDQSSFFGSGEVERKLVFEVNQLKLELACKQVELELECQGRRTSEEALHAQIGESEQRKEDALATLKEASGKSDDYKRECEGIPSTFCVLPSFLFV